MSDYTLTTPEGRVLDVHAETSGDASDPHTTLVFKTNKGSTITLEYDVSDGHALQEVADHLNELLSEVGSLMAEQLMKKLLGGGE